MRKEDWDVEFAAEILRRENEGQVTKPHQGRFDHKEKTKKTHPLDLTAPPLLPPGSLLCFMGLRVPG